MAGRQKAYKTMRFMMLIKANQESEAGVLPSRELVAAMGDYNEEMAGAGVLLAGEGLHPSSRGARIQFSGRKGTVIDGPFAETKELIAGFWLIEVPSMEEAIEWAMRVPDPMGEGKEAEIEIRQVFEASDFPPEILPPEERARAGAARGELASRGAVAGVIVGGIMTKVDGRERAPESKQVLEVKRVITDLTKIKCKRVWSARRW
jgi:hypothetical protein